jgi:tetratricopeptide (TPR) repeat protein
MIWRWSEQFRSVADPLVRAEELKVNTHQWLCIFTIAVLALAALLTLGATHPAHAAPLAQAGGDATLRVINESEETICYVLISPVTSDEWGNDWLGEEETIPPGRFRDFEVASGDYDIALADCDGNALLDERGVPITDQYELRFAVSIDAQPMSNCKAMLQEGEGLYSRSQFREALTQWKAALTCYRETDNRQGEGKALVNLGNVHRNLGQYAKAINYYEQALAIDQETDVPKIKIGALGGLGNAYRDLGQYEKAINFYEQALTVAEEIGDREGERNQVGNLGNVYLLMGRYMTAIEHSERSLAISREIDDRAGQGIDLNNLGIAYDSLGQYEKAIEYYEQALTIAQETGDRQEEGNALGNLGGAYYNLGEYTKAIDYFEKALIFAQEIGDRPGEGRHIGNLGGVYFSMDQYPIAINYYERALNIAQEINDRRNEGGWLGSLGSVSLSMGHYARAIEYFEKALFIAQEIGDRNGEVAWLGNLGVAYDSLGQYLKAIDYYEQALNIAREINDLQSTGSQLGNLGNVYQSLGQYTKAIDYHKQALTIAQKIGDHQGQGCHLGNLGIACESLGQHEKAIEYYEKALNIAQEIGDRRNEGNQLNNLGIVYSDLGQYEKAIGYYEQALSIARDIGDRYHKGNHLGNLGSAYESLGEYTTAAKYYEQALDVAQETSNREGEYSWLGNLGEVHRNLGYLQESIEYYEQAIDVIETLRGELSVEEFKSSFTAENLEPYQGIIQVLLTIERPKEAFHYVQRAKARTFLDQIGNARLDPRATDDPELIEQEQALLAEIRGLEAVLSGQQGLTTRGSEPPDLSAEQRNEVQARLDEAYRDYEHLLAQIKLSNPEYADLRTVDASTLITVQQTLPANTTLVEYYVVSNTQTLAFVVTPDEFHTVPLSVSVESLNQKINWFREFTSEEEARATAQALYDWLFAPVREHIETQAVLIAPHQQLHYLPFDALHDGEHYLVEEYTIGYIPSASVLRYVDAGEQGSKGAGEQRSEGAEEALVLGNPSNPEVTSLSGAEAEAQAVADLFGTSAHLGEAATESRLWEQAADADYVHLAAHGEFKETAPQFSRVYLAPSEAEDDTVTGTLSSQTDGGPSTHTDGLLETREVWNLRLENADLVTLSACQTQLGDLSAGDELVGLSRAFIYAGTPTLVASLWSVEDRSTAYLMERFYGYIQDGVGKAEALRQAKLDTMEEYPSPYHWAAFTLIGDMGKIENPVKDTNQVGNEQSVETAEEASNLRNLRVWVPRIMAVLTIIVCILWLRKKNNENQKPTGSP